MRRTLTSFVALLGLFLLSCAPKMDAPSEQAAISTVDLQMLAAVNSADFDRWLRFMTVDAVLMPPNEPTIAGKPAIQKWVSSLRAAGRLHVAHHVATVAVSRSGNLAYTSYAYKFTLTAPAGKSITEKGKDLSIFKKQSDGS